MAKVRAHIVFDDHEIAARSEMLEKVKKAARISDINEQRFKLYGVLTGTIDDGEVEAVRKVPGVAGVELDKDKYLS